MAITTYRHRALELLGDRDPIEVLDETPRVLVRVIAQTPIELMRQRPFEGNWTPNEILGHLADSEWVFGYRLRAILTEDRPALPWFDQDSWVARSSHNDRDPADLRELFRALRVFNLSIWRRLSPDDLERSGIHDKRGEESLGLMLRITAGHDLWHLRQMERYLQAMHRA
jgi:hypothetical protein